MVRNAPPITLIPNLVATFLLLSVTPVGADEGVRFNRDVRPILSENCFHCHGPDDNARQADLRLDDEAGAKESVIQAGDSDASELVVRILSDDPDLLMPPPESERSLTKEQIQTLRRWVDQGARYEGHWSFITPQRPALPQSENDQVGAIDQFIQQELKLRGFQSALPADRETMIRRVSFDLTGLPPTVQQIDDYLNDKSKDAYQRLIDRLLGSPSFGQRMASEWLDAARYSDTFGYQVDRDRYVWPWRDWVVDAINKNMPYDQFITWQLAGDLLPNPSRQQILATTFNRLHPQKVEGGSVPEEFRIEYVADRTQTVATAMMGLTFECCRCHNHKYDPISQKEYYQLSAFFDNIAEAGLYSYFTQSVPTPTLTLPTKDQEQTLQSLTTKVSELEAALAVQLDERRSLASERIQKQDDVAADTLFAEPIKAMEFDENPPGQNRIVDGVAGKAFQLTGDDAVETGVGNFHRSDPFSIAIWIKTPDVKDRAVILHRSQAWTDAASRGYQLLIENGKLSWSLIHFWPGNAIRIRTSEPIPVDQWLHVTITNDGASRADGLRIYIDGKPAVTKVVRDQLSKNITGGGGDHIRIGERMRDRGFTGGSVDRLRVYDRELTPLEIQRLATRDETIDWIANEKLSDGKLSDGQRSLMVEHYLLRHDDTITKLTDELKAARIEKCKVQDALQEIMVMREDSRRRKSYLLNRGAYDNRGEPVSAGTPAALPAFPADAPRTRLGLARWLCDPKHPLTSRVAVNRLWQICFGKGLVRTPEDFGSQGAPPTHPALLDWMAVEFVENGWDVKAMLKLIMMSETYRQSSQPANPAFVQVDPTNESLAWFPSYRLSAEMLRDNALAISGRLVEKSGGPPAKPYELEASFKPSKRDSGQGLYRRSLYTYWKRTGPAPAMMTLDAAKRDVCQLQRERTSSPLQAFVLLNGPQYVEAARGLAERLVDDYGYTSESIDASIGMAFRVMTSRHADQSELAVLKDLYTRQLEYFDQNKDRIDGYLSIGDAKLGEQSDKVHLAALTVVVSTLMNFDQSMMKR